MKYFLDTEFLEAPGRLDLISIGVVCEDGRTLYRQLLSIEELAWTDWLARNVMPQLTHFDMGTRRRSCKPARGSAAEPQCSSGDCPWINSEYLAAQLRDFCDPEKYGRPEFWAYYADYDWVAFCWLQGRMSDLPKGWPMYCNDLKQLADLLGVDLEEGFPQKEGVHHALADAQWGHDALLYLTSYLMTLTPQQLYESVESRTAFGPPPRQE